MLIESKYFSLESTFLYGFKLICNRLLQLFLQRVYSELQLIFTFAF